MSMQVVITGANRGIGLALTQQLCARGATVYALCREPSDALKASGAETIDNVDVTDDAWHKKVQDHVSHIDLLINNAGVLRSESLETLALDDVRLQFEVNALAPLRVTAALKNQLSQGAKVALITSRMGSVADNTSGGYYGYRMSKAALNAAGKSLANDLKSQGVAVAILHPGFVKTDMVGGNGDITPEHAAKGLLARIDELNMDNSGTFWHANGETLPW